MANLAKPEPEYEPEVYFVLQGDHILPPRVVEECLRESTTLYLLNQERLPVAGNC